MKILHRSVTVVLAVAILSVMYSCKKDARTSWNTELLVPIATSTLSLQNLVKDSSLVTNPDNSLTLAYKSSLYSFNLADQLVNIPDTSIGQKFTLDSLKLPNQVVRFRTSLGFLATSMLSNADPTTQLLGQFILGQNGSSIPMPPLNGFNPGAFHFDATNFFDSAILVSGDVEVWAVNNLPIPVSGATCKLTNSSDNSLVATYNLPYIPAKDSVFFVIPLGGARVTSQLDFNITNLSTPGSGGVSVPVDTSNFIELRLFVTRLRASEAWAKFPPQDVVDITEEVTQNIGERKFTYIDARTGFLHIYITSSVQEQLYLEYTLVGAYDNFGNPLKEFTTVPAAAPNQPVTIDKMIDMKGYAISLTGKDGSKFNTYTQRIIAHIDSSGITRHITLADSLNIRYEIIDVAPNYIKGYAGRDTVTAVDSADFAFLDMFKSGSLDLEDVKMNISVENGIGVDGEVRINGLTAISPNNGMRNLSGSILGQPLVINRATDFPLTPSVNNFLVNSSNSNIKDLIGILPNKLKYDVQVKTNTGGNTQQYRDFAYLESNLKINLNAEVPLSLIANSLLLQDTIDFDISQTNTNVAGITDGVINVIAENRYPIASNITMVLYDENWVMVDTLVNNSNIAAADLNGSCKSDAPKKSKIPLYVSEERMANVKRAKHAVITADFSTHSNTTTCNGQYLKIYSDYTLGVTFTARFNYQVNAKF
ncbi:MAG: hypothetical protein U0T74_10180 [Chitinophagales bacterium]